MNDTRTRLADLLSLADEVVQQIIDLSFEPSSVNVHSDCVSICLQPAGRGFHPQTLVGLLVDLDAVEITDRQHGVITNAAGRIGEHRVEVFGRHIAAVTA